jgi:hypothetical protein
MALAIFFPSFASAHTSSATLVVSLARKGLLEAIQETARSSPPGRRACRWETPSTRAGLLGEHGASFRARSVSGAAAASLS